MYIFYLLTFLPWNRQNLVPIICPVGLHRCLKGKMQYESSSQEIQFVQEHENCSESFVLKKNPFVTLQRKLNSLLVGECPVVCSSPFHVLVPGHAPDHCVCSSVNGDGLVFFSQAPGLLFKRYLNASHVDSLFNLWDH